MSWVSYVVFAGVVVGGGGVFLWWVHRRIEFAEQRRAVRIKQVKRFDAIQTISPIENYDKKARRRGLESVETRFNLMRRLFIPLLSAALLAILALPLLSGAPSTILSFSVGAAAVLVGIAARPFLENLIAGVIISFSQPIRIGDTVLVDGHFGTIETVSMTHTTLKIWDWRRYIVPNHQLLTKELVNYSIIDKYQWAHVEFWVDPGADLDEVRDIAMNAARASRHFADYEDPRFWVMEMGKEGMRCWLAAWADTPSDAWQLTHDIRTELAGGFQRKRIKTHRFQHQWGEQSPAPDVAHTPDVEG